MWVRCVFVVAGAVVLIFAKGAEPSSALSPTECARVVLPDTLTTASTNAEKYAYFSLVDRGTFDENKSIRDGAASYFGYGYGNANFTFDDLQLALTNYKSQQSGALDSSSSLSINQTTYSDKAFAAYQTCILKDEKGPELQAYLERLGPQNPDGIYSEFAIHLTFIPGGGAAGVAKVFVTSGDAKVTVSPASPIVIVGAGSQTLRVKSASASTSSIITFNSSSVLSGSITAHPILLTWKQASLGEPQPVGVGICRIIEARPGPPYPRGSTQTGLSPAQCRSMTEEHGRQIHDNPSFELGCRVLNVDTWDTGKLAGDSDPAFRFKINANFFPPPCAPG
jgi:hypothetical protein